MGRTVNQRDAHRQVMELEGLVDRHSAPRPMPIRVGDLSVGGCLIIGWTAPVGTKARLHIDVRDTKPPVEVRVTVMREVTTTSEAAVGVRFDQPYPVAVENRLSKAIRMLEREKARARRQALEDAEDTAPEAGGAYA